MNPLAARRSDVGAMYGPLRRYKCSPILLLRGNIAKQRARNSPVRGHSGSGIHWLMTVRRDGRFNASILLVERSVQGVSCTRRVLLMWHHAIVSGVPAAKSIPGG